MKTTIYLSVITLLLLACHGGAAQETELKQAEKAGFSQYPLPEQRVQAEYRPQEKTGRVFRKVFMGSGSMTFKLGPNPRENTQWLLWITTQVEGPKRPSLPGQRENPSEYQFSYSLDSHAGILSEESVAILDGQNTRKESAFSVILEDDPLLGANKIIRIGNLNPKNQKKNKEWMVGPEDPIVTIPQLLVWIGSIREIPPEGIFVRCVVEERPLPFLVKGTPTENGWIFTVYPAPNLEASQNPEDYLFQFVFGAEQRNLPGFVFPD